MKKNRNLFNVNIVIAGILFLIIVFFYLRQQYVIIRLEKEINLMYEQLHVEENKYKQLILEIQRLTNIDRLKNLAKELDFIPVKDEDVLIIE